MSKLALKMKTLADDEAKPSKGTQSRLNDYHSAMAQHHKDAENFHRERMVDMEKLHNKTGDAAYLKKAQSHEKQASTNRAKANKFKALANPKG